VFVQGAQHTVQSYPLSSGTPAVRLVDPVAVSRSRWLQSPGIAVRLRSALSGIRRRGTL